MQIPPTERAVLARTRLGAPEPQLAAGPIVVAVDGSDASDAAVRMAWLLAGQSNAEVEVVSVLEPILPGAEIASMAPVAPDFWLVQREVQIQAIKAQLARLLAPAIDWPLTILDGGVSDALVRHACARNARVLVAGRGRHGLARRVFSGEVLLGVLCHGETPLLAVEPTLATLPRRVMVATDFSPGSVYAARVALSLVAADATVVLVHVRPTVRSADPHTPQSDGMWEQTVPTAFARLRERLAPNAAIRIEMAVISGHPGHALAEFAASMHADLVVAGTHGYGLIDRLMLGSVCTSLLRYAPCSVLGVPNSAALRDGGR
jgi:nucleotide-binding universal stress UspA family protein